MRSRWRKPDSLKDELPSLTNLSLAPIAAVWLIIGTIIVGFYGIKPHALLVNLPSPGLTPIATQEGRIANRLSIDGSGQITWNDAPMSEAELVEQLRLTTHENVQPVLHFTPSGNSSYASVVAVLNIVGEAALLDDCFSFSDVWRYRRYETNEPAEATQENLPTYCGLVPTP